MNCFGCERETMAYVLVCTDTCEEMIPLCGLCIEKMKRGIRYV